MSMIRPSRARFLIEAHPEPLALSLPPPAEDLFELYRRIVLPNRPSFLLESGKGGDAVALLVDALGRLPDAGARQVADRLRAVLVAAGRDDAVELGHELVVDGDGHALHGGVAVFEGSGRAWF